jgi:hypothetical protein
MSTSPFLYAAQGLAVTPINSADTGNGSTISPETIRVNTIPILVSPFTCNAVNRPLLTIADLTAQNWVVPSNPSPSYPEDMSSPTYISPFVSPYANPYQLQAMGYVQTRPGLPYWSPFGGSLDRFAAAKQVVNPFANPFGSLYGDPRNTGF